MDIHNTPEAEEIPLPPMSPARISYVREMLDAALPKSGFDFKATKLFADAVLAELNNHSFPLPEIFFDFERNVRICARLENIHEDKARKLLTEQPAMLLEMHDVKTDFPKPVDPRKGRTANMSPTVKGTRAPGPSPL